MLIHVRYIIDTLTNPQHHCPLAGCCSRADSNDDELAEFLELEKLFDASPLDGMHGTHASGGLGIMHAGGATCGVSDVARSPTPGDHDDEDGDGGHSFNLLHDAVQQIRKQILLLDDSISTDLDSLPKVCSTVID